jgi:hypothetical protein
VKAKALATIAAAIVALLLPVGAWARGAPAGRHHPTVITSLNVPGSNGFSVGMGLVNRRALGVSAVSSDGPSLVVTSYKLDAQQAPGSDDIRASLGRLGSIDVHFVRDSINEEEPPAPVCAGEKVKVEEGHFVGLIEFRGEHGYTSARATRAPGTVAVYPPPTCHRHDEHGPHRRHGSARALFYAVARAKEEKKETHSLGLKVKTKDPEVQFQASRLSGPEKRGKEFVLDSFFAGASRDRGRIHEESAVLDLLAKGPYFKVPDLSRLTSEVVLEPPRPFLGSATLRHEPGGKVDWSGDLRLPLPGFGIVPLTGPGVRATLCADAGCRSKK